MILNREISMEEIILRKKYPDFIDNEYLCEITKFLDDDIRNNYGEFNSYFKCYIYDCRSWHNDCFAIRMPGSTIGRIRFNDKNVITECCIYDDILKKSSCFSEDINEQLKRFVGSILKLPEE